MAKNLILHIGTPKTATTSIQYFLKENTKYFHENNIFPLYQDKINNETLFRSLMQQDVDAITEYFTKKVNSPGCYILSCELFYTMPLCYWQQFSYDTCVEYSVDTYQSKKENCITFLKATLDKYFDHIEVIIFFRDPVEFINSNYIQDVQFNYVKSIEDYSAEYQLELDYAANLFLWGNAFGRDNVSYFLFDDMKKTTGIESFFCEALSIPYNDTLSKRIENNSLTSSLFLFKKHFNEVFYSSSHRLENLEEIFYGYSDRILQDELKKGKSKHREISQNLAKSIYSRCLPSNKELFSEETLTEWNKTCDKKPSIAKLRDNETKGYLFQFLYEIELSLKYDEINTIRMIQGSADWNYKQDRSIESLDKRMAALEDNKNIKALDERLSVLETNEDINVLKERLSFLELKIDSLNTEVAQCKRRNIITILLLFYKKIKNYLRIQ